MMVPILACSPMLEDSTLLQHYETMDLPSHTSPETVLHSVVESLSICSRSSSLPCCLLIGWLAYIVSTASSLSDMQNCHFILILQDTMVSMANHFSITERLAQQQHLNQVMK
jgi:hypothetical protein